MVTHTQLPTSLSQQLKTRILALRLSDPEQAIVCCKQLLEHSDPVANLYDCAFSYVYLVDGTLALDDQEACGFYLTRAEPLCRENGYEDLHLLLCNWGGLYYLRLSDDQSALSYFLRGLDLAKKLGDHATESKLFSNIGFAFGIREAHRDSFTYFTQACRAVEQTRDSGNNEILLRFLCNAAEEAQQLGLAEDSRRNLERCEALPQQGPHWRLRLDYAWCYHHAFCGDPIRSLEYARRLLDGTLSEFGDKFFVFDALNSVCRAMLHLGNQEMTARCLTLMDSLCAKQALRTRFQYQTLKVRYCRLFCTPEEQSRAHREYYELSTRLEERNHASRVDSMLSKLRLTQVLLEREAMLAEGVALEELTRLDELTRLINRRQFNKLVSKASQDTSLNTLGFIMLDIDFFKQYNDFYGHFKGDEILRAVADAMRAELPDGIAPCRYGGDEFVCLCTDVSDQTIEGYIRSLCQRLDTLAIAHAKSTCNACLTLSIGFCNEPRSPGVTASQLLDLADQALYCAKQGGRNTFARKRLAEQQVDAVPTD